MLSKDKITKIFCSIDGCYKDNLLVYQESSLKSKRHTWPLAIESYIGTNLINKTLWVCHNRHTHYHKIFDRLAAREPCSIGWFMDSNSILSIQKDKLSSLQCL